MDDFGKTQARVVEGDSGAAADDLPTEAPHRYSLPAGVVDPELGRGGMGRVLRLEDAHLGREVAVKELLPGLGGPAMEALFVREARVLARLEHPGVVPVYELARRADGTPFYVMRRIRGEPLGRALERCVSLEERLALLQHFLTVVQAVAFAHSRGVVHRDLKPDNVMVSRFGETQVIDWGLAVVDGQPLEGGVSAGTPAYMAPEQAAGTGVDARSDVWSLGVMLYELLTGRLPFLGPTVGAVLEQVRRAPLPKVTFVEPKAPAALVAVAARALQRAPEARFPDAQAMADALEVAMMTRPPRATGWRLAVTGLSLALVAALAFSLAQSGEVHEAQARAERALVEAGRDVGAARAEAALALLRQRDAFGASRLAREAVAASGNPLGRGVEWLAREAGAPSRRWSAHTEAGCSALAVVGDVVGCGTLSGVALFGVDDGASRGFLSTGPQGWQQGLASLESGRLVSGGDDGRVRVWDIGVLTQASAWPISGRVTALDASGGEVVVGLRSGEVFRLLPEAAPRLLSRHPGPVLEVAVDADGDIASASAGLLVAQLGAEQVTLERPVGALRFIGARSLVAGIDRQLVRFDGARGEPLGPPSRGRLRAIAVDAAGHLVSGDAAGVVRWHFADGAVEAQLDAFAPGVQALEASGAAVLVATVDRRLESWVLPERTAVTLPGSSTVHALVSGDTLVSGDRDGRLRWRALATGESGDFDVRHEGAVRAVALVPGGVRAEGLRLLSGGDDGAVREVRQRGEALTVDSRAGQPVLALAVSADGHRAAWAWADGSTRLWSLEYGREIASARDAPVRALVFSPDSRLLASGRDDKRVQLMAADTGREVRVLGPLDAPVTALAFSPDGASLAAGTGDGRVTVWRVADGRVQRQLSVARVRVGTLAFSADGQRLASGSDDGATSVWNVDGAQPWAVVPADAGGALLVGFGDEGSLVSVGADGVLHRWEMAGAQ